MILPLVSARARRKAQIRARAIEASARLREELTAGTSENGSGSKSGSDQGSERSGSSGRGSKTGSSVHFSESDTIWYPQGTSSSDKYRQKRRGSSYSSASGSKNKKTGQKISLQGSRRTSRDVAKEYRSRRHSPSRTRRSRADAEKSSSSNKFRDDHKVEGGRHTQHEKDEHRSGGRSRDQFDDHRAKDRRQDQSDDYRSDDRAPRDGSAASRRSSRESPSRDRPREGGPTQLSRDGDEDSTFYVEEEGQSQGDHFDKESVGSGSSKEGTLSVVKEADLEQQSTWDDDDDKDDASSVGSSTSSGPSDDATETKQPE